jgi:nitrogenase molybdenum-iron protein alpha/beta subunit
MMPKKPPDLTPDGFTGAIMAVEGIRDAAVLLNGPTGCKFYHGAMSDGQLPRQASMNPLQFAEEFYFGQPRVPATYLDNQDYVFGATEKLEKILPAVAAKGHRLIAVVNSPGAALIGDDLERFIVAAGVPVPCLALESAGFSDRFSQGFQEAVVRVLQRLAPSRLPVRCGQVNLIGLSVFHRHWAGDVAELTRLIELCGITVNTVLCAGCTVDELEGICAAEANLVVHDEFADRLMPFLRSHLDMPSLDPIQGAPLGFGQTRNWIEKVCEALAVDATPALDAIDRARQRAYAILSRFNALTGLPRGATFAMIADGSIALPLTRWLYEYLGMVPVSVIVQESTLDCAAALGPFLTDIDCADALNADLSRVQPDLVFGGEGVIGRFRARGIAVGGIDIALPGSGSIEIIDRCQLGATGALWLLERILNGLLE